MTHIKLSVLLTCLCCTGALTSCATLFSDPDGSVLCKSVPTGAEVLLDGESAGKTPCTIALQNRSLGLLTFRYRGQMHSYQALRNNSHWTLADGFVDPFLGVFPIAIDTVTGAARPWKDQSVVADFVRARWIVEAPNKGKREILFAEEDAKHDGAGH